MVRSPWVLAVWAVLAAPSAESLTLDEAVTRALDAHPGLERWEARSRSAAAKRDAAALPPPFVISAQAENPLGAEDYSGIEAGEATLQLSRVIERGGKRSLRREAGEASLSRAELEVALQRTALLAEITRRFVEVVALQAQGELAIEALKLANESRERVEWRVQAARSSEAEAHGARMDVARARLSVARAEGQLKAARARLSALWGDFTPSFERAEADLFRLPPVPMVADAVDALTRNPELMRLRTERQVAAAEAELARAERSADVTVTAGAKYFGELDTGGVALSFSLPLGTRTRAAPVVRAAEQDVVVTELALESQRRELAGVVAGLVAEANARQAQLAVLQDAVIPEGQAALLLYQQGYDAGRHSFIALADARRRLIAARAEAIDVAREFHRLMVELDRLTQDFGGRQR